MPVAGNAGCSSRTGECSVSRLLVSTPLTAATTLPRSRPTGGNAPALNTLHPDDKDHLYRMGGSSPAGPGYWSVDFAYTAAATGS